ncbi:hypothetical protein SALWKB12_0930 [Snodgrassella communis]|nr:hypothetical protein SALWKB12_0930 [Snodgrassella communis]
MEDVVVWLADDEINKDILAFIIDILLLYFEINKDSGITTLEEKHKKIEELVLKHFKN